MPMIQETLKKFQDNEWICSRAGMGPSFKNEPTLKKKKIRALAVGLKEKE